MEIIKTNLKFTSLTKRKKTVEIILHCTSNPENSKITVEDIHKFHLTKKWSGIGYHYVIKQDGKIYEGRPEDCVGAHCTNHNSLSIGIAYVGGVDSTGKAKDTRTPEQKKALVELVKHLLQKYKLTPNQVYGHYQLCNNKKACPSFDVNNFKLELL